jgi:hypothetical protein
VKLFLQPKLKDSDVKHKAKLYNMFYELIYIGGMEYNFVMEMDYEELAISHQALVNIKGD